MSRLLLLLSLLLCACAEEADTGPGNASQPAGRTAVILGLEGQGARGQELYFEHCSSGCHLDDGKGKSNGGIGKDLTAWLKGKEDRLVVEVILQGRPPVMAAYGKIFSDQEVADLVAFLRETFEPR